MAVFFDAAGAPCDDIGALVLDDAAAVAAAAGFERDVEALEAADFAPVGLAPGRSVAGANLPVAVTGPVGWAKLVGSSKMPFEVAAGAPSSAAA